MLELYHHIPGPGSLLQKHASLPITPTLYDKAATARQSKLAWLFGEMGQKQARVEKDKKDSTLTLPPWCLMPVPACFTQSLSESNGVWRVLTTTDVGNVSQGQVIPITKCYP